MPLNHYLSLGNSGLRVSPFCLGAMTFGEDWSFGSGEAESKQVLDRYLERGGNFIDTANVYTKGHSEKIIGDHIGRTPSRRDRVVIATKFFGNMYSGDPNGGGASRKSLTAACEQSLRRLQTDYIDLYWMHCWDRFTPIEETMRALDDLVRSGTARHRLRPFRSRTRSSNGPSKATSCRWRGSSASASRRGRRSRAACCPASTRGRRRRPPTGASV